MTQLIKRDSWFYSDGPVQITADTTMANNEVVHQVNAKFGNDSLRKDGFTSQNAAFLYGLDWTIDAVQLTLDRLKVLRQQEKNR